MTDFTSHKIDLAISTLTNALEFVSSKENEFERLGYAKAAISLALSDLQAITTQVEQWAAKRLRRNSLSWWNHTSFSYSGPRNIWSGHIPQVWRFSLVLHPLVVMHWIKLSVIFSVKWLKINEKAFF